MITLNPPATGTTTPETVRFDIDLGSSGSVALILRKPNFATLLNDMERREGYAAERIRAALVGWEGVQDESGNPITFSFEGFTRLCEAYPLIALKTSGKIVDFYLGIDEAEEKN